MKLGSLQKIGGISLILGSSLLTIYAIAFPVLLPSSTSAQRDMAAIALSPNWQWITLVAFHGVILTMFGYAAVYTRLYSKSGVIGLLGFLFLEIAYLLQACKVTWEAFLFPVIASHEGAAPLLRDQLLKHSQHVIVFRTVASLFILMGIVLFCFTLIRSREFPKSAGALIFLGAVTYAVGPAFSTLVAIAGIFTVSIGSLILGWKLMREQTS